MTRKRRLTDEQVKHIQREYVAYVTGYETLAKRYGVGASTIRDIVTNRTQYGMRVKHES